MLLGDRWTLPAPPLFFCFLHVPLSTCFRDFARGVYAGPPGIFQQHVASANEREAGEVHGQRVVDRQASWAVGRAADRDGARGRLARVDPGQAPRGAEQARAQERPPVGGAKVRRGPVLCGAACCCCSRCDCCCCRRCCCFQQWRWRWRRRRWRCSDDNNYSPQSGLSVVRIRLEGGRILCPAVPRARVADAVHRPHWPAASSVRRSSRCQQPRRRGCCVQKG